MAKETNSKQTSLPFKSVLLKLMADRALSATQIAALAGVARSVVGDWTNGSAPRDLAAVGKLAKALGLSMRELLLDEVEDTPETQLVQTQSQELGFHFDEVDLFDGLCRVSIRKLVAKPRQKQLRPIR